MVRTIFLVCLFFTGTVCSKLYSQGIITTIAGNSVPQYIGDGYPATNYSIAIPVSICIDKQGSIYIADFANLRIRKLKNLDSICTIAGDSTGGYTGNGGPATAALLDLPNGVCLDTAGNLYITELYNHVVRKIDATTGIITTVCGSGVGGFSGDGGLATACKLNSPGCACINRAGDIFVPDKGNQRIRKVDHSTGIVSTIAGNGTNGYSGDGGDASNATLSYPYYICADTADNLYFCETGNNTVRRIDHETNIITTVAGTGTYGYTGDGGQATNAKLDNPVGVYVDKRNIIYIADYYNYVVRAIFTDGIINTIVGNGYIGYTGDGGPATNATLYGPASICVNDSGTIFVADDHNSVIRKISPINTGILDLHTNLINLYPNPTSGKFVVQTGMYNTNGIIEIFNTLSQSVFKSSFRHAGNIEISIEDKPAGIYFIKVTTEVGKHTDKIVVCK